MTAVMAVSFFGPPVRLIHKDSQKVVTAISVDIDGRYPNTVHTPEMGFWIPAEDFEFANPAEEPAPEK